MVNPKRPGAPIVSPAAPSAVISVEKNSFHFDSLQASIRHLSVWDSRGS